MVGLQSSGMMDQGPSKQAGSLLLELICGFCYGLWCLCLLLLQMFCDHSLDCDRYRYSVKAGGFDLMPFLIA